ncbi:tripartite tricarboxylate transporter substrate binding protein [Siccirubricoccus sp. G192]|uniref:Bug family tripartite tricarboxylate transporter substrate binding protein n=1 Tax=Siccirubricoccus sp. G192 TaxID=2849651 RepID=UPI0020C26F75|nr:tripartite tricarboxylate transporter substrate binding protein [Siccirubricoccus sp. G192]
MRPAAPLTRSAAPIARNSKKILGVTTVVENRPGGSATIGTGAVIRARPDGYTIGLGSNSSMLLQPLVNPGLGWSTAEDFTSVVKLGDLPCVLAVRADAPWRTLAEFIEHARANPRRVRASNSGLRTTPDLATHQLNRKAGTQIVSVPFTGGGGEALLALLGGRVEATVGFGPTTKGQVEAGKVRILAVFARERYELFPDAATTVESGFDVTLPTSYYVIAPKGLAPEVLARLTEASVQAVTQPDFISFAKANGYILNPITGDAVKAELTEMQAELREVLAFVQQRS